MRKPAEYLSEITGNDYIDADLYNRFNVKRGLRNADGTGVLVGLTRIGDVHGYIIDEGEKIPQEGKLYYRGYDVEALVRHAVAEGRFCFEETVYLLLFGQLPDRKALDDFSDLLGNCRTLPPNFAEDSIMGIPSPDIMNTLARSVLTLYSYDEDPENKSPENVLRQCLELIGRFPTMVAYAYRARMRHANQENLVIHLPEPSMSTAEALLSLMRTDRTYSRLEAEILDLALVLHAEHGGGNNSTFAVHLISSADTDTYSAIAAGIQSLKGAKHGGANIKVMGMIEDIKKNVKLWDSEEQVSTYLAAILRGEAYDGSGLIYGQGHPVYTKNDPRALMLRDKAALLAEERGLLKEFNLYRLIERLSPQVFRKVKGLDKEICSNVDFYSGFVYKILGIPTELYTSLFAVSRVAGWCAHRLEEIVAGGRIIRPAYKCVQGRLDYIPLAKRESRSSDKPGR
ncbi:MAG: citrate/2-methylcitrate synthase [Treponema sp.]|jgi:citrate synthase|nr:citrate/2-methylcitrate synthase [Treponema sp.]